MFHLQLINKAQYAGNIMLLTCILDYRGTTILYAKLLK